MNNGIDSGGCFVSSFFIYIVSLGMGIYWKGRFKPLPILLTRVGVSSFCMKMRKLTKCERNL